MNNQKIPKLASIVSVAYLISTISYSAYNLEKNQKYSKIRDEYYSYYYEKKAIEENVLKAIELKNSSISSSNIDYNTHKLIHEYFTLDYKYIQSQKNKIPILEEKMKSIALREDFKKSESIANRVGYGVIAAFGYLGIAILGATGYVAYKQIKERQHLNISSSL